MRLKFLVFLFLASMVTLHAEVISGFKNTKGLPVSTVYQLNINQAKVSLKVPVFESNCNIYNPNMSGSKPKDSIPLNEYRGRSIHFANISFSKPVEVILTVVDEKRVSAAEIKVLPGRFGIKAKKIGKNKYKFSIEKPGQYSVEIGKNGYKHGFLIFANPLENDVPTATKSWAVLSNAKQTDLSNLPANITSIKFQAGVHHIGVYKVPNTIKNIYLEDGSWVYGAFVMDGADKSNVKIYGRGVISGAELNFRESHQIEALNGANNITVQGITITDFSFFAIRLLGKNNFIQWSKIVGGWIWNCDGIAAWEGSVIKNCFIWANDDNLKIYEDNIVVEDIVCWQLSNGAIFQLNWGSMKAKNCVIRNVDIVRAEWHDDRANNGILSCRTAGGANSNFVFENIRTDNPVAFIFRLSPQGNISHPIENFVFKNWDIKMDYSKNKKNYLMGSQPESTIKKLVFDNFKINNVKLTQENYTETGRFIMENCEMPIFVK